MNKYKLLVTTLLFSVVFVATPILAQSDANRFGDVQRRLIADGFNMQEVSSLYRSDRVEFDISGISLFFRHQEGKLNYDQFLSDYNIRRAREYLTAHEVVFNRVEGESGVDRQVIAAIILVETKLGNYLGNRTIISTLSTMAALNDPTVRSFFWSQLSEKDRISKESFEEKATRKATWAYQELKAFLTYTRKENVDPLSPIGSYAGAMGLCQFMPSNILTYGQDGNGDGHIDLYDHADAIASIARYLKSFGWYPGIQKQEAYKVVWHYNRSSYYVNTVLGVAALLKG